MLKQYHTIKARHNDCILFFRLGDFYEMFYEDAKEASEILEVVLTSRGKDAEKKVPMCGIPYHAADTYIAKLIKAGKKVAICEQVEDPAHAKGIVKRDVVRVITSGTFIDDTATDSRYLLCLLLSKRTIGFAFTDVTNGIINVNQCNSFTEAHAVISRLPIYECIFPADQSDEIKKLLQKHHSRLQATTLSPCDDWSFNYDLAHKTLCEHFHTHNLRGFGIEGMQCATASAGALLEYLKQMHRQPMRHIHKISIYSDNDYAFISPAACYGLELDALLNTMDRTQTPVGKRLLRHWLYHPLKDRKAIQDRHKAVAILKDNNVIHNELKKLLRNTPDIEKHLSRISAGYNNPRDLLALRQALSRIPHIQEAILPIADTNELFGLADIPSMRELLVTAVNPELPVSNAEGKAINRGYNAELDDLRNIQENGRQWLKELQRTEIKRTGINSLKIGFNKVFGYYLEVSKPNLHLVPPDYIRKQTLVNGERFITPGLKEFEEKMLTAEEKIVSIETHIIEELCKRVLDASAAIHAASVSIAILDVLHSLSTLACTPGYCVPDITDDSLIWINDGRHPVVESCTRDPFVPNDTVLDCAENHFLIITGPNMAGKSTYIRQNALLVIMAQMGSFIPAASAHIGVVDKIFTRIGAHDEISKGQSTFMVEMSETAGILNNLSERSLVILDEIGRGTSTYDGLSLAWAVAEFLIQHKVRTLFATHFHELTILDEKHSGVKNYNVAVKEWNDEVVFLHKIVPGGTDDSYGIYVAKLAGIPKQVVDRSRKILTRLELKNDLEERMRNSSVDHQMHLPFLSAPAFNNDPLMQAMSEELEHLDINALTPVSALNLLNKWKDMVRNNETHQHSPP